MCGIVGYIGHKEAYPVLIKGLRRLEYRGYDSAGVALINNDGNLNVYKTKGKVDNLTEYCNDKDVSGSIGIAHTRWATHGEPSSRNAHPHYSQSHNLAIIHNGRSAGTAGGICHGEKADIPVGGCTGSPISGDWCLRYRYR